MLFSDEGKTVFYSVESLLSRLKKMNVREKRSYVMKNARSTFSCQAVNRAEGTRQIETLGFYSRSRTRLLLANDISIHTRLSVSHLNSNQI